MNFEETNDLFDDNFQSNFFSLLVVKSEKNSPGICMFRCVCWCV